MKHFTATALWHGVPSDVYGKGESQEAVAEWESQGYQDVTDVEERQPRCGWTVVFGNFRWGAGIDLADAKHQFRKHGGKLSDGYAIAVFDQDTDFVGFGGMGYHYLGNAPEVTEVHVKKAG
jgi:hypothetical protein